MSCYVISCHVMSCHVVSRHVTSCRVLVSRWFVFSHPVIDKRVLDSCRGQQSTQVNERQRLLSAIHVNDSRQRLTSTHVHGKNQQLSPFLFPTSPLSIPCPVDTTSSSVTPQLPAAHRSCGTVLLEPHCAEDHTAIHFSKLFHNRLVSVSRRRRRQKVSLLGCVSAKPRVLQLRPAKKMLETADSVQRQRSNMGCAHQEQS